MRIKKPTAAELTERFAHAEREASTLALGLHCVVLEGSDAYQQAEDGGWLYQLSAYRLTGPHGGIVVMRATCTTNFQADSVTAFYLDDARERFSFECQPNLYQAIGELIIAREAAYRKERRRPRRAVRRNTRERESV